MFSIIYSPVCRIQESIRAFCAPWKTRFLEFCQSTSLSDRTSVDTREVAPGVVLDFDSEYLAERGQACV